jgi:hypothetical protein
MMESGRQCDSRIGLCVRERCEIGRLGEIHEHGRERTMYKVSMSICRTTDRPTLLPVLVHMCIRRMGTEMRMTPILE